MKFILGIVAGLLIVLIAIMYTAFHDLKNSKHMVQSVKAYEQHRQQDLSTMKEIPYATMPHNVNAALNESNMTDSTLVTWAAISIADVMTFSFSNHQEHFNAVLKKYFTEKGGASFYDAVKASRMIEAVEANKQIVRAVARAAPIIVRQGVVDGVYQWIVMIPSVITYTQVEKVRTANWSITLVIARSDLPENDNGIGIAQWIAVPE